MAFSVFWPFRCFGCFGVLVCGIFAFRGFRISKSSSGLSSGLLISVFWVSDGWISVLWISGFQIRFLGRLPGGRQPIKYARTAFHLEHKSSNYRTLFFNFFTCLGEM